jgi:hypothetical protein
VQREFGSFRSRPVVLPKHALDVQPPARLDVGAEVDEVGRDLGLVGVRRTESN